MSAIVELSAYNQRHWSPPDQPVWPPRQHVSFAPYSQAIMRSDQESRRTIPKVPIRSGQRIRGQNASLEPCVPVPFVGCLVQCWPGSPYSGVIRPHHADDARHGDGGVSRVGRTRRVALQRRRARTGSPAFLRHPAWSPARATRGARVGAHRRLRRDGGAAQRPDCGGVHPAHGRRDVSSWTWLGRRMDAGRAHGRNAIDP